MKLNNYIILLIILFLIIISSILGCSYSKHEGYKNKYMNSTKDNDAEKKEYDKIRNTQDLEDTYDKNVVPELNIDNDTSSDSDVDTTNDCYDENHKSINSRNINVKRDNKLNDYFIKNGISKNNIPEGDEHLYILKSKIVPPVCPICPSYTSVSCDRNNNNNTSNNNTSNNNTSNNNTSNNNTSNNNTSNNNMPIPVLANFSKF